MVLCFDSAPLSEAEIKDRTLKKRASLAAMSARNKKKLMLLGAGESGKSTIFKAVKVLYSGGYSPDERAQFTWIIHRNVIDGVQAILQGAQDMGHDVAEENEDLAERTLLYEGDNLNADLAADVAALWADPAVKRTFDERDAVQKQTMLHINDSAGYFLDDAARFAQPATSTRSGSMRPSSPRTLRSCGSPWRRRLPCTASSSSRRTTTRSATRRRGASSGCARAARGRW